MIVTILRFDPLGLLYDHSIFLGGYFEVSVIIIVFVAMNIGIFYLTFTSYGVERLQSLRRSSRSMLVTVVKVDAQSRQSST